MSDERPSRRPTRDRLQDGRLHLEEASRVEEVPEGTIHLRPLDEYVSILRIDDQVHIPHAVALLRVGEGIIGLPILYLHDRERSEGLGEQDKLLHMDADLAHLGAEDKTLHPDDVANVKELLEDYIIERLILLRCNIVAGNVELYPALAVLELSKGGLAHDPSRHQPPGYPYLSRLLLIIREMVLDVLRGGIHHILLSGVGVDPQVTQLL